MTRVIGLLPVLILLLGCASPSTKVAENRKPAEEPPVYPYPLNSKFEKLMPHEALNTDQIRGGILASQAKLKAKVGEALRGTHAKGTCLQGTLTLFDLDSTQPAVASRLKKGIFSAPGNYPTDVRFANADGGNNPDDQRDVRAVSLSVQMPTDLSNPKGRMDFTFNNATTFPINDSQAFADIEDFSHPFQSVKEGGVAEEGEAAKDLVDGLLIQEQAGKVPYQKMHYWSTVPFALGDDEAVKYKLDPCPKNHANRLKSDRDKLQNELIRHVNSDKVMSCFNFQVQPLEAGKMTHLLESHPASWWVENASVKWSESQAPFYTVGKLTLVAQSIATDQVCGGRWVSILEHNNAKHRGLGSINRVRAAAEAASKDVRLKAAQN